MNDKGYCLIILLLIATTGFCTGESSVVAPGAEVEKVAGGFRFTEGPAADAEGNIFFTDIPNNRIHKWSLGPDSPGLSTFRENSSGANGLYFDKDGNLLACQGEARRLVSMTATGEVTVLAEKYKSKRLNQPNDLWIDPKGGIYFTDPYYGRDIDNMEQDGEHVYYLSADQKNVIRVADDLVRPNGLIGTPDGGLLYIGDHRGNKTFVYAINEDGTLSDKKLFAPEGSDGMTIDNEGNIYLTTDVVAVYNKDGQKIQTIRLPESPANVTFGGKDTQTLYITARTSLYSIKMRVKGAEPNWVSSKAIIHYESLDLCEIPISITTPSLVGKPLPDLKNLGIELSDDARDKMIMVCFWDMQQRPSRNYILQLAERADELAEKDVVLVCVQESDIEQKRLNEWLKENQIPFPVGRTTARMNKSRVEWGVKSLPWLLLTDRRCVVTSEGFGLGDISEKVRQAATKPQFEEDIVETSNGELKITFIGHGTLMFTFQSKIIHLDPIGREADYTMMPKADIILITHEHGDHLDEDAVDIIRQEQTEIIFSESCEGRIPGGIVMQNGEVKTVRGLKIEAVPAYNMVHMRSGGNPYHPKGEGNGYVITFGDKRVYVAGDTENTPEMKSLKNINVAFLPMNLPYTMTPEMIADAAKAFEPKVLYPYHYGRTDPQKLVELLKDSENIEVRIREMR